MNIILEIERHSVLRIQISYLGEIQNVLSLSIFLFPAEISISFLKYNVKNLKDNFIIYAEKLSSCDDRMNSKI